MDKPFVQFGTAHLIGVLATLIPGLLMIAWAKRSQSEKVDYWMRIIIAWIIVFFFFAMRISRMIDGTFSIQEDLPLHLCGFSSILIPFMLFNKNFKLYETMYFWGVGGATQSLLTPTVQDPFPSFYYWEFFFTHSFIIIGVLHATIMFKYRPTMKGLFRTYWITFAMLFPMGLVNWAIGANYFFIAHKPETASLLDIMGPWPFYLFPLSLVALTIFLIIYTPFPIMDWVRRRSENKKILDPQNA